MSDSIRSRRLHEILAVLRKHQVGRGLTPEKVRMVLEDLGPTYIKLGQIVSTRTDILPKKVCEELTQLRSDVTPMPLEQVKKVFVSAFGCEPEEMFESFEETPIGSASIAQVHRARLRSGDEVVVKVQRIGIYDTMRRDVDFLHRALKLLAPIQRDSPIDLGGLLDEMWAAAKEEMDFLVEASHMEEFQRLNEGVAFCATPRLYREYTTEHVLCMEYIDGHGIDELDALIEDGYDLEEIGLKMADNYVKQIMVDGFFHGDPHPGNLKVRGGQIVWIDLGMMGRFTDRDKALVGKMIRGVAEKDVSTMVEAVLSLGKFDGRPNQQMLYTDINDWMTKYGTMGLGDLNMGALMEDLLDVMRENKVSMPRSLTMLMRGLTTVEGVISTLSPKANVINVAAARLKQEKISNFDLKEELARNSKGIYDALIKGIRIPGYISDMLRGYMNGQLRVNLDMHATQDLSTLLTTLVRRLVMGFLITALFISSSIICTTNMTPRILEIPIIGFIGYLVAAVMTLYIFVQYLRDKRRRHRKKRRWLSE